MWVESSFWFPGRLALMSAGTDSLLGFGVIRADNIDPVLQRHAQCYADMQPEDSPEDNCLIFEQAMLHAALDELKQQMVRVPRLVLVKLLKPHVPGVPYRLAPAHVWVNPQFHLPAAVLRCVIDGDKQTWET